jgi:hypothetical protein
MWFATPSLADFCREDIWVARLILKRNVNIEIGGRGGKLLGDLENRGSWRAKRGIGYSPSIDVNCQAWGGRSDLCRSIAVGMRSPT